MNSGIQGLAADIFKVALVRIDQALEEQFLGSRLVLQVHDEVLVEVPEGDRAGRRPGRDRHHAHAGRSRRAAGGQRQPGTTWAAAGCPNVSARWTSTPTTSSSKVR